MDFRAIPAEDITWTAWYRGQPGARTAAGQKVVVQTPRAACRVSLAGAGMFRIDMAMKPHLDAIHEAFCSWVGALEEAVGAAPDLQAWRQGKSRSTTLYNNNLRLMAFSDTLCFDDTGTLSFDLIDATNCACIVELQGCWSTEARWGLRWKVTQVKFGTGPVEEPKNDGGSPPAQAAPAAFAFLDE